MRRLVVAMLCVLPACRRDLPPEVRRVDGAAALRTVEHLCRLGPRHRGGAGYEPALAWLGTRLAAQADEVEVRQDARGGRQIRTLVARLRPKERPRLLLATHWDTRAVAEADPDPARRADPVPGANDGASGVAVLLELLPHLRRLGLPTDVVLFDAEEALPPNDDWLSGSEAFAAALEDPGRYRAALVLDMVCRADPPIRREGWSEVHARAVNDLVFATAAEVAPSGPFEDRPGPRVADDHSPLQRRGVPAVLLIGHGDPAWHTTADKPDRCDPAALSAVAEVVLTASERLLAGGEGRQRGVGTGARSR